MFADAGIEPDSTDRLGELLCRMKRLGFSMACVRVDSGIEWSVVEQEARRCGIAVVRKVVVKASTRREARIALDTAPRAEVVSLEPLALDAARYAAANKRVNLVRVEPGMERALDRGEVRILRAKGFGAFEVSLRHAIEGGVGVLKFYHRVFRRAFGLRAPLVISSGARDVLELWEPRSAAAFIAAISGVPFEAALRWLSTSALSVAAPGIVSLSRRKREESSSP